MLTIPEEIFLLALNDAKGNIPHSIAIPLRFTLSGAALTELFLGGKVGLNEHGRVILLDADPCCDPILNEALETIKASAARPKKIAYWLKEISPHPRQTLKRLGEGLVQKGILRPEEKRYLWVIPYSVFPQQDASAKYWVKQHLRGVILAGELPDVHTVMVLNLVCAGELLDFVFTRDEIKAARKRIAGMMQDPHLKPDVVEAIAEIETNITALVVSAVMH